LPISASTSRLRARRELHEIATRQRHAAKALFSVVQLDRTFTGHHVVGLVGERVHVGAARRQAVGRGALLVHAQVRQADAGDERPRAVL